MTAANTRKSAQHLLEAMALGTVPADTGTAGGPGVNKYSITATIPTAAAAAATAFFGATVSATANGTKLGDIAVCAPTTFITGVLSNFASVVAVDAVRLGALSTAGFTGASQVFNVIVFGQS